MGVHKVYSDQNLRSYGKLDNCHLLCMKVNWLFAEMPKFILYISCLMITNIPVQFSHVLPKHPLGQIHVPSRTLQIPPFTQGLGTQIFSVISAEMIHIKLM